MNHNRPNGRKRATLGEFFRIKHGWAFKGGFFADAGPYVLLTPGNFKADGGLQERGEREKYYVGDFPSEFLLKRGDFLVVMTDLTQNAPILGSPAIVPEDGRFLHNQRLGKIVDLNESEMDKRFLYYLFNSASVRAQVKGSATGATVKHTAPERIYSVNMDLPPLPAQRKIADILSAYDDLIENNTRRIKILEEMARAIYREWFVHFHFPGHEKVKLVDSPLGKIPERWELKTLGEIAVVNGLSIKKGDEPSEINYVDIASVSKGQILQTENLHFEEAPGRARRRVKHGDIIWSAVRPNLRAYALILDPAPNLIVSTGFAVISPQLVPYSYLYQVLTTDEFVQYLVNHTRGAAYPAVNTDDFEDAKILVPGKSVLEAYHSIVSGLLGLKQSLLEKKCNLRHTRDLLLPKLILGDLDVSAISVDRSC